MIPETGDASDKNTQDEKLGKKKEGFCIIKGCAYQEEKTEVGGCDVCLRSCQPLFDQGFDSDEIEAIYAAVAPREEEVSKTRRIGELAVVK
jgi:hypothetical protein